MQIVEVTESNIAEAGYIHSEAWKASHRAFCAAAFVEQHTPAAQADYLRREMAAGKRVYMLTDPAPVGIVSVQGSLIENLYVLPQAQNRGCGTRLLRFAMERCDGVPTLWILNNNDGAYRLYARNGFGETGNRKQLSEHLYEIELEWSRLREIRRTEAESHRKAYSDHGLYESGSWLAKPVRTVLELLPLFEGDRALRALDLGCGVGRNSIPAARVFRRVDCVDILELAIEKLRENARRFGVADIVHGFVSPIESFPIAPGSYDLILAISALEHVDSEETFLRKLAQIRDGIRPGGVACLIVNTGVQERDKETRRALPPQFEVNLHTEQFRQIMAQVFTGWHPLKHTVVHQKYDIPREHGLVDLETDVVTYVIRRPASRDEQCP